jgi:hypothetical protein
VHVNRTVSIGYWLVHGVQRRKGLAVAHLRGSDRIIEVSDQNKAAAVRFRVAFGERAMLMDKPATMIICAYLLEQSFFSCRDSPGSTP